MPNRHEHQPTPPRVPENLSLMLGRLIEATQTATDGLRSLSQEQRQNQNALLTAVSTIEVLERTVHELDQLVRTGTGPNADSLIMRVAANGSEVARLLTLIERLERAGAALRAEVDALAAHSHRAIGMKTSVVYTILIVGWLLTTGIALYAALKQ